MFLKNISITHFKSHAEMQMQMGQRISCITGSNGVGKTNLLDSIYCILNGKSYFQMADSLCIMQNEAYYILKGNLEEDDKLTTKLMVSFQTGKRKAILINDKPISKLGEFFGKYPCVVIAPNDVEIVLGESEQRRRFFDYMLSVVDTDYLKHLTSYTKVLELRNKQLKLFIESNSFDKDLLDFYDQHLKTHGTYIFETRRQTMQLFETLFNRAYAEISTGTEIPVFKYISQLQSSEFIKGLGLQLAKDRILGRTNFGTHRDDWSFELNDMALKKTGSQGQIKSFLIALKLAMYNFIFEKRKLKPLLLLDDIFEKIDHSRMSQLVEIISKPDMGQVIITDTNKRRVEEYFEGKGEVVFFEL